MHFYLLSIIFLLNVVNASTSLISPIWGETDFKNIIIGELNNSSHILLQLFTKWMMMIL